MKDFPKGSELSQGGKNNVIEPLNQFVLIREVLVLVIIMFILLVSPDTQQLHSLWCTKKQKEKRKETRRRIEFSIVYYLYMNKEKCILSTAVRKCVKHIHGMCNLKCYEQFGLNLLRLKYKFKP